jgi:hypothetical protein
MERNEDYKKFIRLGNKRVNHALKYIRLIGNLSNTSNYYYTNKDVKKIFATLRGELDECEARFNKKETKQKFSLELEGE